MTSRRSLLLVGLVVALAGCGSSRTTAGYEGGLVPAPYTLPADTLTDQTGAPATLASLTSGGKALLLYFGYTGCPDTCPTTMADIAAALRTVSPAVRSHVTVAMVTSDPVRDTPAALKLWLSKFDPSFMGLTGGWSSIHQVADAVGVLLPDTAPANVEDVGHSAQVIGFSPDGKGRLTWLASQDGKPVLALQLAHDLPLLVAG